MTLKVFGLFNVVGGVSWVVVCSSAGYLFGHVPFVERNSTAVVLGIVALSLLPAIVGVRTGRRRACAVSRLSHNGSR